jgi:predicted alpha/beta superfamily hydrolase
MRKSRYGSLGVIGASIGANLALQALANHPEIPWAVLLSPGLNYRGLKTRPLLETLQSSQRVLLVASSEDIESLAAVRTLAKANPELTTVSELANLGHGTEMIERQPQLIGDIIKWIKTRHEI